MLRKKRFYVIALLLFPVLTFVVYALYRFQPFIQNQWDDAKLTAAIAKGNYGEATFGYLTGIHSRLAFE